MYRFSIAQIGIIVVGIPTNSPYPTVKIQYICIHRLQKICLFQKPEANTNQGPLGRKAFHHLLRMRERPEPKLFIQKMRIGGGQPPDLDLLQLRFVYHCLHQ